MSKKKKKMVRYFFRSDLYSAPFLFFFGEPDMAKIRKDCVRFGITAEEDDIEDIPNCQGACSDSTYGCMIWMPFVPGPLSEQRTLVHEIVHASLFTGRRLGFGDGREADEFRAYMADWLFGKICQKIW